MDWARADEASKILNPYRGSRHPEVLWRRGRVLYLKAEEAKSKGGDRARHARLVREGFAAVQLALEQDPDCGKAHQWMSVLRYSLAELEGTLARLKSVDNIRADMERAIQLLPGEDVPRTMLGMWFYEISQLTWLERQVVQAAGQTVPKPDHALRQAVHWFHEAERLHPAKSCLNQLMLGKALLAEDDPERARACIERAASIPPTSSSNAKAQLDARQLLECWKQ
ncbi:regulator of microtubule dynamics protein 1-like [Thrips palmi]|uniref:Regulator of microtubule dynamics protein 1 n=1 Tax=Thrips palmi TaxID=161013 RepID=A0A6P8Z4Z2_THRPL|nr:regulator of microtubule dynamics protein 1-like [Thrips palmi]